MIRTAAALSLAGLLVASASFAAPDKSKKSKVVQVMTCPIMGSAAKKGGPSRTLKTKTATYMVHFCCGMCPGQFDKLSAAEKEKKVKAALAKKTSSAEAAPKLVEVNTCPIMGGSSVGAGGGSTLVGNYKVNFCCGGCKGKFDALSKADQQSKIQAALKKT